MDPPLLYSLLGFGIGSAILNITSTVATKCSSISRSIIQLILATSCNT